MANDQAGNRTGAAAGDDVPFVEVDSDQVPATDITFECPHCSKSLSIEPRGAGLVIACAACHQLVTVPIPEGMELADIDSAPAEKEVQVANLRRVLAKADVRIEELEAQVASLREYRTTMERVRARTAHKFAELRQLSETVMKSQMDLSGAVTKMLDVIAGDD